MQGLSSDELTFKGKKYNFENVPMLLRPVQKPHPPLWYGLTLPQSAPWPAANDVNCVILGLRDGIKACVDAYHAERKRLNKTTPLPLLGPSKHVVIADTDEEAMKIARRAYAMWRESFFWLFKRNNTEPRITAALPPTFDELMAMGNGVAGSPQTVRNWIKEEAAYTGINYFVSWLAFGDMTLAESSRSVELFSKEVMPAFAG